MFQFNKLTKSIDLANLQFTNYLQKLSEKHQRIKIEIRF